MVLIWCSSLLAADTVDVRSIAIVGVDKPMVEKLRLNLSSLGELDTRNRSALLQRLTPPLTRALQAFGYYRASIDLQYEDDLPRLQINPGPALTWGHANIQIRNGDAPADPELVAFATKHPFQPSAAVNHATYETFKQQFLTLAKSRGYLEATLTRHQLRIDLERYRADVELALRHGQAFRFGVINFNGSSLSRPLLQRLSGVKIGESYNANRIGEVYDQLLSSGYFAAVTIEPRPQPDQLVDLAIELQDAPKHRFTAGVGYGTDTGPRLKFTWQRPQINSRGDSLQTQLEASAVRNSVSTQYRVPWPHPLKRYLNWESGWQKKTLEDTDSEIITTGLAFHNLVTGGWQSSYQVDLEREDFRQGSQPRQSVIYVIPGASWARTLLRGEAHDPYWGFKLWFGTQASSTQLGSDTDFVQFSGGVRYLSRLSEKYQLVARATGGVIYAGNFFDVPASRRFFAGGDQSVRGFDFESLSPQDSEGELTGGQRLTTASLEMRRQWRPNWQWAVFADTGRAYIDSSEPFHTGAGIGLRWQSPLGILALDVAKPVNSDLSDSVRLHIYMGLPL